MGMTSGQMATHLTRSNLWSAQLKDILEDELDAQKWVDWLDEFPDGTTFNVPSVGQATTQDVVEDTDVQYEALDTGNFTFTIDEYVASAHYMTRKAQQDSFYAARVLAQFVPKESRAIAEHLESNILNKASAGQTGGLAGAFNLNAINGKNHRYAGSGGSGAIALVDVAYAKLALKKANVPMTQLIGIVPPETGFVFETLTNIVNVSNNPQWEGLVQTGISTGMRFIKNVYGFDIYESNYLPEPNGLITGTMYEYDGSTSVSITDANEVMSNFFSAAPGVQPIMGAMRQMPIVDSEFNKDKQREEYVTTARWGIKLYRPENMVTVITTNAVS